jgi:predicted 2-oxoglutarate/Fe(II)-dependent dioxygenase YbiX|tara:strand:+ start:116 stop:670 length:555 start_codon:yes stop_codon:yes gene_type:complete
MQISTHQKPFVHTIIDDFFEDAELPSVFSEIDYLNQHATDTKDNGDPKSSNMNAVHLDKHYKEDRYVSSILRYNRKIFDLDLSENIFSNYLKMCNFDVTQLNCYNGDGSYDLHPDLGVLSAVTLLFKEPKQFTGGQLSFSDYNYVPHLKNNSLILFPSFVQHEVKPIKGSGRYSLNHFFFVHIR